ncbi:MAG: AEC family transporter [Prevotellaceae bacterium]|jgi:predicted permease|nr:AEC family transporter [Prevotellaceae bacterium]
MSDFLFSINVVLPLFLLIATGYILKQLRFVSESFLTEANKFVFNFPLPLMLFQNIRNTFDGSFVTLFDTKLILSAFVGIIVVIVILLIVVPLFEKRKATTGSLIQGIFRSNFIIYGLPLATSMYGDSAIIPISMLLGVVIPVYNIAAVVILTVFSETKSVSSISFSLIIKNIFKNPLIIACIAGFVAGTFNIRFPVFIESPVTEISKIATPLALMVMGGLFEFRGLMKNFLPALIASLSKLVVIPLIAMIVFVGMGFRGIELAALLCLFATPTAVASFIMAENMGCDGEISAHIVVMSTALSAITIFLFIFALKSMEYI